MLFLVFLIIAVSLELASPPGLDFVLRHSPTPDKYVIETMTGGVALLDYDQDGLLDIFLVNGGRLEPRMKMPPDYARRRPEFWNRLYRQGPAGRFTDVTHTAGLSRAPNVYGMGVATGDFDNNGFPDIYVTGYGGNQLYRNNGDGTFTEVTREAGVGASGWSVSAAFLDFDSDGHLDLFVSRYLEYDLARNLRCGIPFNAYCRPERYEGTTNLLFRNLGNGTFRDVSEATGFAALTGKGMGVAVNDYDGDNRPDIFVSNDLMEQFLFHNNQGSSFEERALQVGVAFSDDGKPYSGMGAAFADYDNDGRPDILVTNLAQEKWALYRNDGKGMFSYATLTSGLAAIVARNSGWGVGLYDFDNDGWKDIFAAQSHVLDNVERMNATLLYEEPPGLYRNVEGKFEPSSLGKLNAIAGRGVAFGDLNNDGSIDAVVSVLGGRPLVLMGRPGKNHWLILKLIGTRSNRDGIGATIRTGTLTAYVTSSGSYLSASDTRVHFGLGDATRATVEILWPSGTRQTLTDLATNRILTVKEPE
jgi:enediyne biosynthesis protein E4